MRWLAMIKHETNTYSPVPTPLERFFRGNPGNPGRRTRHPGL